MLKNTLFSLVLLLLFVAVNAVATPVGPMNYQGRLLNDNGVPVTGSYNFVVRIYDDPVSGTLRYQESMPGVSVNDGVYSFRVGVDPTPDVGTWDVALWQNNLNDLFLEVEVDSEILLPRHELTSAPHAFTSTLALSLGNRTAEEYDNLLEGICVTSRSKWLDTVEYCAGEGVDLSNTNWNALDAGDSNYANIDLVNVNFTNSQFNNINLSGSHIRGGIITGTDFSGSNFTNATIDGAFFFSPPDFSNTNLTNATIINMDLSGVDLSTATLTGVSMAKLLGCPTLPAGWECHSSTSDYRYIVMGAGANYSSTSGALISRYGTDNFLDLERIGWSITNLSGADFSGTYIDNRFRIDGTYLNLQDINFKYAQLSGSHFFSADVTGAEFTATRQDWTDYIFIDFTDADFTGSILRNAEFRNSGFLNVDFSDANIVDTLFYQINANISTHPQLSGFHYLSSNTTFDGARLFEVIFDQTWIGGMDFSSSQLRNVTFNRPQSNASDVVKFEYASLENVTFNMNAFPAIKFDMDYVGLYQISAPNITLDQSTFVNASGYEVDFSSGSFVGVDFSNAWFDYTQFDNADLQNANFTGTTLFTTSFDGADLTGATFSGNSITQVTWVGATCPDGNPETSGANTTSCEDQF